MQDEIWVNGASFTVIVDRNKTFWNSVKSGQWETETFDFFRQNITPETLVLDVGAWIGATALYAAQLGAKCIAFEPDPVAFAELQANYNANEAKDWITRLSVVNAAVTVDGEPLKLGSRAGGGDSTSSALFADEDTNWVVPSRRLPDILSEFGEPNQPVFVKIDIEGGEYTLIPAIKDILARDDAGFHLSLHPKFLRKALRKRYSSLLWPFRFFAVRYAFVKQHQSILAALPLGKRINVEGALPMRLLLTAAAITGRFPKEIHIATG